MTLMALAFSAVPDITENLLGLDWWQQVGVVLGVLGLSGVPWIASLAAGRLGFTRQHGLDLQRQEQYYQALLREREQHCQALLQEKDSRYSDLEKDRDGWKTAAERHEERGDRSTELLERVVPVLQAANTQLAALNEIAREAGK